MLRKDGVTSSHTRNTRWRMRRASRNEKASPAAVEFWILLAYYEKDAHDFVKRCHTCQIHANLKYFTKWVEAVPLRKATGAAVSNFIREYIVCRFGIPYKMVIDNGTPFVNKQVSSTLSGYGIKHRRSTPYYPQGNGQAEATNKTILIILSKMVYEYEGGWSIHLPDAL
ncbi:unnamed protein product [Prunus armeniaca]